jgi:hypothetical protein
MLCMHGSEGARDEFADDLFYEDVELTLVRANKRDEEKEKDT